MANETGTITLKLVVQDLMTGNIGKAISGLDKLAQKGGLVGSIAQGVGQKFGQMLNPIGLVTNGIGALTDFLGESGKAASDLNETQTKLTQVFSTQANAIRDWAKTSATAMGLSEQKALEATGTFGNFLQAMGDTEPVAAKLSEQMVQLASDLGSFNNVDPTTVLDALQSGLAGQVRPLRQFGIDLSASAVKAEGLRRGLKAVNGEFTAAENIQSRVNLIMKQSTKAQGDFARTADGTANKTRTAAAETENFKAKLGELVNNITNVAQSLAGAGALALTSALDAVGQGWNALMRQIQPGLAFEQDVDAAIRAQAQALGLNGDALIAYSNQQRQYAKDAQAAAAATAENQAAIDSLTQTLQQNGASTDEVAAAVQNLKDAQSGAAYATDGATAAMTDNEKATAAAKAMVDAFVAAGMPVPKAMQAIADGVTTTLEPLPAKLQAVARKIPVAIGVGLRAEKGKVRSAMVALKYEMDHPITQAEVKAYALGRLTSQRLAKGLRSSIPAIRAAAQAARDAALAALNGGAAPDDAFGRFTVTQYLNQHPKPNHRASGGPVSAGRTYMVGENGPEWFTPGQSGGITPRGGDIHIHLHTPVNAMSPIDLQRSVRPLMPEIRRALAANPG